MAQKNDYSEYLKTLSPLEQKIFRKVQTRLHREVSAIIKDAVDRMSVLYDLPAHKNREEVCFTLQQCWMSGYHKTTIGTYAVSLDALKQHTDTAINEFIAKVNELSDELTPEKEKKPDESPQQTSDTEVPPV